ncbi:hypothetical protein ABZW10_21325 [Kitasatospora sp. NPDC004723]|uniref:hypothetical protein n=1 Tax=Kitasatospora sp. NPDC004723 TaxID=3154288 RepID=UPI0033BBA43E
MENGEIGALLRERDARAWRRAEGAWGRGVHLLGLLALGAWLWAVGLAFVPASHEFPNGTSVDCGSPMFYEYYSGRDYTHCAAVTDGRMRDAVGVGLVTLPLSVVWLWRTVSIRLERLERRG